MSKLSIKSFINNSTQAVTHCVTDRVSGYTAIIDPSFSAGIATDEHTVGAIDSIIEYIDKQDYHLQWILKTSTQNNDLRATSYLKSLKGGQIGGGEVSHNRFNLSSQIDAIAGMTNKDDQKLDQTFSDNELIELGHLRIQVMYTQDHLMYLVEDSLFVGNLFLDNTNTCSLNLCLDGKTICHSCNKILALPNATRIFVGHGSKAQNEDLYKWETSIIEQKLQLLEARLARALPSFNHKHSQQNKAVNVN